MELTGEPGDYACPVWQCRGRGARFVTLHQHWQLAPCAEHADDIEQNPDLWRLASARADGVLRIAKVTEPAPGGWSDEPKKEAGR